VVVRAGGEVVSGQLQFAGGAAVERRGVCRICGRALKNPKHAAAGIGPVCAKKQGAALGGGVTVQSVPPLISDWHVVKSDSDARIVWIVDEDRGGKSVTNDADNVAAELAVNYPGYRIIYRDSIGRWDELCHDGALFVGFRPASEMAPASS
jgi:hypothetical protein